MILDRHEDKKKEIIQTLNSLGKSNAVSNAVKHIESVCNNINIPTSYSMASANNIVFEHNVGRYSVVISFDNESCTRMDFTDGMIDKVEKIVYI